MKFIMNIMKLFTAVGFAIVFGINRSYAQTSPTADESKIEYLGGLTICANDSKTLAAWYTDIFGIKLEPADNGIYWGSIEKLQIGIHPAKGDASKECDPEVAKGFVLTFHVNNYKGYLDRLKAKGIVIESAVPAGDFGTFAYFRDPENNKVAIWGK